MNEDEITYLIYAVVLAIGVLLMGAKSWHDAHPCVQAFFFNAC